MKKIIIIMLMFMLLLSGCSTSNVNDNFDSNSEQTTNNGIDEESNPGEDVSSPNNGENTLDKEQTTDNSIDEKNNQEDVISPNSGDMTLSQDTNEGNKDNMEPISNDTSMNPGNTPGNIMNVGFAATDGEWEYFWAGTESYTVEYGYGKLCKMKPDGTEFQVLTDDMAASINVVGEWVYYIKSKKSGFNGKIYRVRKDGTNREELYDGDCVDMTVVGDQIYFINLSDGAKVYKMKTDGSKLVQLNQSESYYLQYANDWLYYLTKDNENYILYKMKAIPGSEPVKIMEGTDYYIISGEWIYYKFQGELYRMKEDGTNKTKLVSQPVGSFNVTEDSIYWFTDDEYSIDEDIYKMNLDGSGLEKLVNERSRPRVGYPNIVGEYIYYWFFNAEFSEIARMKTDGSEDEIIIGRLIRH